MRKIDQATVKALELRAPGASIYDAKIIEGQLRGAQIFNRFREQEGARIFSRLRLSNGLIPSLHTFFRNIPYCEVCIESMKHLTLLSRGATIFTALERHFTGLNQQDGLVVIQVSETDFTAVSGSLDDQVKLGHRQLFAFAMRHFCEIPQEKVDEAGLVMPRVKADRAVLRQYAGLANRLGFESTKIQELLENRIVMDSQAVRELTSPLLVTSGPGNCDGDVGCLLWGHSTRTKIRYSFATSITNEMNKARELPPSLSASLYIKVSSADQGMLMKPAPEVIWALIPI